MNNPEYVKVNKEKYKINTDFRVAIECNQIAEDNSINDYERALAIIYKLFGERGLDCENKDKLIELGIKYITFNKDLKSLKMQPRDKYDLDFSKCQGVIRSSFKFDYNYDPYELEYLHWYDFYNDMSNLSTSEFGTCCALNRILSVLQTDETKIKDSKERAKIKEAKEELRKKYCINTEKEMSKEQEESAKAFYKSLGIEL